ncbi:MAG TPA: hypothetical protein VL981_11035 [Candidatus Methylacidiphilales bacterium]|nr:hypothetical protein [Candidatus Methylacidiphilales bacterium]
MSQTVLESIDTPERAGEFLYLPVAALTSLYAGTLIALNSSGFATYATDAAGLEVVGRAEYNVNNSADAIGGALSIQVRRGVFKYFNSSRSSGAYALAAGNVGQICYVQDEQTVQTAAGSTNKIIAGVFLGLDTDGKAWIDTRLALYESAESLAFTQTQDSITDNSGGTAPTPASGVMTIASITSTATAANAISGLIVEINKIKADVAAIKALL